MAIELSKQQIRAVSQMKNGCILCGGVGSGKSRTALAYYYVEQGGRLDTGKYEYMNKNPMDLYIITTAHKRDSLEWEGELPQFLLSNHQEVNYYGNKIVIDSWNNIGKYADVKNAFFIFDEQRVIGKGVWVKSFLKIVKTNSWILLSATPGDTWPDYIPVFIANGFYKNRTDFNEQHVIFKRFSKFPQVDRYVNTRRLVRLRDLILVDIEFDRHTVSHHKDIYVDYDDVLYKTVMKQRWNIWEERPFETIAELCYSLRKIVNSDESRGEAILDLFKNHKRLIIFYNFDYELEILRGLNYGKNVKISEWNGHKHQPIPEEDTWVYLVQYTAGCEGWNCIKTDTIVFYSQNYSYKVMVQAAGRTDRLNTPFTDLFYYHLKSRAPIDLVIARALIAKKDFNERKFIEGGKVDGRRL